MIKPLKVLPEKCQNYIIEQSDKHYFKKDLILYALGIGASINPMDTQDLKFTYENHEEFSAIPSFLTVLLSFDTIFQGLLLCPGIPNFNPLLLLHADEDITMHRSLPEEGTVNCITRIKNVYDKQVAAVFQLESTITLKSDQNEDGIKKTHTDTDHLLLATIQFSLYIRDIGNFNGALTPHDILNNTIYETFPILILPIKTSPNQAILYRLSGDLNPLHIDPNLSKISGFQRPILHGLCTFGIVCHALIKHLLLNSPGYLQSLSGRFSSPVYPGNELILRVWKLSPKAIVFHIEDVKTKKLCLKNGRATFTVLIPHTVINKSAL